MVVKTAAVLSVLAIASPLTSAIYIPNPIPAALKDSGFAASDATNAVAEPLQLQSLITCVALDHGRRGGEEGRGHGGDGHHHRVQARELRKDDEMTVESILASLDLLRAKEGMDEFKPWHEWNPDHEHNHPQESRPGEVDHARPNRLSSPSPYWANHDDHRHGHGAEGSGIPPEWRRPMIIDDTPPGSFEDNAKVEDMRIISVDKDHRGHIIGGCARHTGSVEDDYSAQVVEALTKMKEQAEATKGGWGKPWAHVWPWGRPSYRPNPDHGPHSHPHPYIHSNDGSRHDEDHPHSPHPYTAHHRHRHPHGHGHGDWHRRPQSFLNRLRRSLLALRPHEALVIAFVLGAGIGAIMHLVGLGMVLMFRRCRQGRDGTDGRRERRERRRKDRCERRAGRGARRERAGSEDMEGLIMRCEEEGEELPAYVCEDERGNVGVEKDEKA